MPPFRSIEAFVAAARAGSLTAAAAELGLSVPALSRRIQALEQDLGQPLLRRLPRGVTPTPRGATYLTDAGEAIDRLRAATHALREGPERPRVRVSLIPSLATSWLMPRLRRFHALHPSIEVELDPSQDYADLDGGAFDFAIRLGELAPAGIPSEPLLDVHVHPVCDPTLAASGALRTPADLAHQALLGPGHRPEFWPEWARAHALDPAALEPIRRIDGLLLYEAAASGMGVAIALDAVVAPYLASGRLVRPFEAPVRSSRSFRLLSPRLRRSSRPARIFRTWLLAEAARATVTAPPA
ncbi:LysR substrate-binding domain-containing protein [Chelatococcus reniformis]|uniref:LysR substrate-binding domain-containing protein n=1 Tax=Chelatococcus reniformis TaxID=1494448 RepID=UPI0016698121|nr:LysR substrate-binding domain-containing protein [Chelatococcus reniformis]